MQLPCQKNLRHVGAGPMNGCWPVLAALLSALSEHPVGLFQKTALTPLWLAFRWSLQRWFLGAKKHEFLL
ncbi:hypothetical protein ACFW0H_22800 [Pseudomonas sp. CR3202]|uniref:hypothetical protein n=1 Tax=Pseudomonas sp. CR3202 TaxID=3351532 RepID=UPI003BF2F1A4